MDTHLFDTFIAVQRAGGFAAAAREMHRDPSAISRSIAQLESELGVRLFHRTTRQLALTAGGHEFLQRIVPIVDELERARDALLMANSQPRGSLKISVSVAFGTVCILPHLQAFRAQFPAIDLALDMTDRNVDMVDEGIDIAIRLTPVFDADVVGVKLMDTRYRVVASPAYLDGAAAIQKPSDIAKHRPLCSDLPGYRSRWLFKTARGRKTEVAITPGIVISNALGLREAALNGLGPALLADWLVDALIAEGKLIDLFPGLSVTATSFDTGAWLLYPERAFLPERTRVAVAYLRSCF
ncbi:MAG: LysR substrate-binding domain-containing protein [Pseudomonadota bacterium]